MAGSSPPTPLDAPLLEGVTGGTISKSIGDGTDKLPVGGGSGGGFDPVQIIGTSADDCIIVASGTPALVQAGEGADTVLGGAGGDTIDGGFGNDWVDAGAGDDVIVDVMGSDTAIGGTGNDAYHWMPTQGASDVFVGGSLGSVQSGIDKVVCSLPIDVVLQALQATTGWFVSGGMIIFEKPAGGVITFGDAKLSFHGVAGIQCLPPRAP
jgi:Ca2+-binding RTX toxin-like protein